MTEATTKLTASLSFIQKNVFVKYGLRGVLAPGNLTFTSEDGEHRVTLTWAGGETILWELTYVGPDQDSQPLQLGFGDIMTHDPATSVMQFVAGLVPRMPKKVIRPKGKFFAVVFGWTLALAALSLFRLIGASIPPAVWSRSEDFPDAATIASTVQQLARTLSIGDLPMLVVGSFVNMPVAGLLVIAAVAFGFILYSMPQIMTADDLLSDRAVVVYAAAILPTAWAVMLAPVPLKFVIVAVALCLVTIQLFVATIPWQLGRWMAFARHVAASDVASTPVTRPEDHIPYRTIGDGAGLLHERAASIRQKIWKKRDKALTAVVQKAYGEARQLRIDLRQDFRAARRGRPVRTGVVLALKVADTLPFHLRAIILRALPGLTVLSVIVMMFTSTPWIAPSCVTDATGEQTVYLLSNGDLPTYLEDSRRIVVQASSWDGLSLTSGACSV